MALPLTGRGVPIGILNLLTAAPNGFDEDACKVLEELADDLAYGIFAQRAEAGMRLLKRAVEASANGVMITDVLQHEHPITYVNPGFEAITGYSASEVLGTAAVSCCRRPRSVGVNELRQALRERRGTHVTLRCLRKDGSPLWS